MKPMVSVIVPVYNAEQTLRRCVSSILDQQYTDLELLLVNDGSTDASGEICDEFAARDARVTVLHQKNAGVSTARNHALEQAQGTYLQFLDSDDSVSYTHLDVYKRQALGSAARSKWPTLWSMASFSCSRSAVRGS